MSTTADIFSARTRRLLSRSPYAPIAIGEPVLRTDVLCRLLVERLTSIGPMLETAAIDSLEQRAPGRGEEVIRWAGQRGLVRRVAGTDDEPATLEAVGAPRSLAA
jgi:hypothetical protein